jgi:hypothetical protein
LIWFHLQCWKYDKDIKMPSSQRCGLDFTHVFCWYDRPWGNRSSRLSTFGVFSLICLRCCVHPIMYALHVPHPDSHRTPKRFVCFVQRSTRQWHCARHHGIGPGVNSLCCSSWYHKCPMVPWWFTMGSPRHMPHWGSSAPSVCLAPQSQKEATASSCLEFGTPPLTQLDKDLLSTQFAQLKQTF